MQPVFPEERCRELLGISQALEGRPVGLDYAFNVYAYAGKVPLEGYAGEYLMFYRGRGGETFYVGSRFVVVLPQNLRGVAFDVHMLSACRTAGGRVEAIFAEKGGAKTHLQPVQSEVIDAIPKKWT